MHFYLSRFTPSQNLRYDIEKQCLELTTNPDEMKAVQITVTKYYLSTYVLILLHFPSCLLPVMVRSLTDGRETVELFCFEILTA